MPIRPENRARYPKDWPELSRWVKVERAGGRCECEGECGRREPHAGRCTNVHGEPDYATGKRTVMTCAHLNHVPEDVEQANLRAFCAPCHLSYDRQHHVETRRRRHETVAVS